MEKIGIELKIGGLTKVLEELKKPSLTIQRKDLIRNNLLNNLKVPASDKLTFSFCSIIQAIKRVVKEVHLTSVQRVSLKEQIFAKFNEQTQKRFFCMNFFAFHKRLIGSVLAIALFFGMFSFLNIDTGVVFASNFTTLNSFGGGLLIERDGGFIDVYKGMKLYENDQIITGDDGEAVIEYFDYSTSRLAPSTHLVVKELDGFEKGAVYSHIKVSLVNGTIWSKVVNLFESRSSFIVEAGNIYVAAKKAAFNVQVLDENKVEIGVFKHVVDVQVDNETTKFVSGKKVSFDGDSKKIETIKMDDKNDEWVQGNLESDQKYLLEVEDRLLAARVDAIEMDADDVLQSGNSIREDAVLFLTFDDVKKQKMELELAEKKFIAAQVKLHDENLTEQERQDASQAITDFSAKVKDFYSLIDEVKVSDPAYSLELESYIEDKVLAHKKYLSVVFPDSPIYETKEVVEELELLGASDDSELAVIRADQAIEKLALAEEAIGSNGDVAMVEKAISSYKEEMNDVVEIISSLSEENDQTKEKKDALVERVNIDSNLLAAVEAEVEGLKSAENTAVADPVSSAISVVPADSTSDSTSSAILVEDDVIPVIQAEPVVDGPYGVKIQGDKPLPPFLQDIK